MLLVEEVSKYFLPLRRGDIVAFRPPPNLKVDEKKSNDKRRHLVDLAACV